MAGFTIIEGGLDRPAIVALLDMHLRHARQETGEGSAHAMDIDRLRAPDIRFFAALKGGRAASVGALKRLEERHGEVKSMRTHPDVLRQGAAALILGRIIEAAREEGMSRLSLETGSWPYFIPARRFYARHGFTKCPPFPPYVQDPNSVFMTRTL